MACVFSGHTFRRVFFLFHLCYRYSDDFIHYLIIIVPARVRRQLIQFQQGQDWLVHVQPIQPRPIQPRQVPIRRVSRRRSRVHLRRKVGAF